MLVIVFFLLSFLGTYLNALEIQLKPSVKVQKKHILLADVTETCDDSEVFSTIKDFPIADLENQKNLNVTGIDIQMKLLSNFGIVSKVKGFSSIIFNTKTIKAEEIISSVHNFLREQKNTTGKLDISLVKLPNLEVNSDHYSFNFQIVRETKSSASLTLKATLLVDHQIKKNFPLTIEVYEYKKIAVANQTIRRDDPVNQSNIIFETRKVPFNADVLEEKDIKNNNVSTRLIPKGKMLKSHHLKVPDAVKRNDSIKVYVNSGLLTLAFQGIAKENGQIGDVIEIQNPSSKEIFTAKVINNKTAQIALGGL